jgi:hypothetical protein
VKYFLLVYNRRTGELSRFDEFPSDQRREALHARFLEEERERDHSDIEVVVLGAESADVLKTTHGRYFKTIQELVEG